MTGLELPILAMEHMYLITEEVPQLAEWRENSLLPGFHVMDLGGEIYMREEGNSLLLGTYERKRRAVGATPDGLELRCAAPDS